MVSRVIPSYFTYQRQEFDDKVVITCLDRTLTQDLVRQDKDLYVYADTLTINSALKLPGRKVVINARNLVVQGGSLNVTGGAPAASYQPGNRATDGRSPGDGGQAGASASTDGIGKKAGDVTIAVHSLSGDLVIEANGGVGGRGQDGGNGSTGANGKDGADAVIVGSPSGQAVQTEAQPGKQGGKGGAGGAAGQSGKGGDGGKVTIAAVTRSGQTKVNVDPGQGGAAATPGGVGAGGAGGVGGRKARCWSCGGSKYYKQCCELTGNREATGPVGSAGDAGPQGRQGDAGARGTSESLTITDAHFISTYQSTASQRRMTLHAAELSYLKADYANAYRLLQWVQAVTPASGAVELVELHTRATSLLGRLRQGQNYYAKPRNFVPLLSLEYYKQQVTALIAIAGQIEDTYASYLGAEGKAQDQLAALNDVISKSRESLDKLQTTLDALTKQKNQTQDSISQLTVAQEAQSQVVTLAQAAFKTALDKQLAGCTFADILSAVKTIVQIGQAAYSGIVAIQSAVGALAQEAAAMANVIKQIEVVGKSITSIQDQWGKISKLIDPKTAPDAGKLVMQKDDFDKVMKPFLDLPEAAAFKSRVHDFLDIIQSRNQKVYEYNIMLLTESELRDQISQKSAELERIKNSLAQKKDPTLPEMRLYMEGLYQQMKSQILRLLYEENQALEYMTLKSSAFPAEDRSVADLGGIHANIITAIIDYKNGMKAAQQPFDLTLTVSAQERPEQFRTFVAGGVDLKGRKVHDLTFSMPVNDPKFRQMWQVVAESFTMTLPQAKTSDDLIYLLLMHSGRAQFLDSAGDPKEFSHLQRVAALEYDLKTGVVTKGGQLQDADYIGLSPSTTWTIRLPVDDQTNPKLDLSGVNQIVIKLHGHFYPVLRKPGDVGSPSQTQ